VSFLANRVELHVPFVVRLLDDSHPTAIFFVVVSVAVYAVNLGVFLAMFRNVRQIRFVHIVLEGIERFPLALDSPRPIPFVPVVPWILATAF